MTQPTDTTPNHKLDDSTIAQRIALAATNAARESGGGRGHVFTAISMLIKSYAEVDEVPILAIALPLTLGAYALKYATKRDAARELARAARRARNAKLIDELLNASLKGARGVS